MKNLHGLVKRFFRPLSDLSWTQFFQFKHYLFSKNTLIFKRFRSHPRLVDNEAKMWISGVGTFCANAHYPAALLLLLLCLNIMYTFLLLRLLKCEWTYRKG